MAVKRDCNDLFDFIRKYDIGFFYIRLALILPILGASNILPVEDFASFSQSYHFLLLASNIVLFGLHERLVVGVSNNEWRAALTFRSVLFLLLCFFYGVWTQDFTALFLSSFFVVFRVESIVQLSLRRASSKDYLSFILLVLLISVSLPFVNFIKAWLFVAIVYVIVAVIKYGWPKIKDYKREYSEGVYYTFNQLLTAFTLQGAFLIYSVSQTPVNVAKGTHELYVLHLGTIFLGLLYRGVVVQKLNSINSSLYAGLIGLMLVVGLLMYALGAELEALLFGEVMIETDGWLLLAFLLILQSFTTSFSSVIVSSGNIKKQYLSSTITAAAICTVGLLVYLTGMHLSFAFFILFPICISFSIRFFYYKHIIE